MNGPYLLWNYNIHLQGNFSFGGFAPEPPSGNVVPRTPSGGPLSPAPLAEGISPLDPAGGVNPPYTPPRGWVYILLGCKVFMEYKHNWKQRLMNQEDNQAPQPTISHLETDLNNSTTAIYAGIWTFLDLENFSSSFLKTNWNWARTQFLPGYSLC